MTLTLTREDAMTCCASEAFAESLSSASPFKDADAAVSLARHIWWTQLPVTAWLAALAAHPRIGDVDALRKKFDSFTEHSQQEQAAASHAPVNVLQELAEMNRRYEAKFGHVFIICASGKSAQDMLAILKDRYGNEPHAELAIAAAEQMKITELRIRKLYSERSQPAPASWDGPIAAVTRRAGLLKAQLAGDKPQGLRSPVTSHMLDTSVGRPAHNVPILLDRLCEGSASVWETVGRGSTNADGRIGDLMSPADTIQAGTYRITFELTEYVRRQHAQHGGRCAEHAFYPEASVTFQIMPDQTKEHFHIPLTWSPYGYSTYRGS